VADHAVHRLPPGQLEPAGEAVSTSLTVVEAAEAAVIAHFAALLAGRLEERHFVERTRALCDQARRAVRLLAEPAPAVQAEAGATYRAGAPGPIPGVVRARS
jgi:hypothetical protein